MEPEFTLDEAREVLSAVRALAPDGLRAPLSAIDVRTVLGAGIEIKDVAQGLLDFPTTIEGESAYWCWQSGETDIGWWHLRDAGFAGRQPLRDV
jgi:hypothetical protein